MLMPPKVIVHVTNTANADLCLTVEEDTVLFHQGQRFSKLSSCSPPLSQFPRYCEADICNFINRYTLFNSHLVLNSLFPITDFVTIKMIKLLNASGTSSEVVLENGRHFETIVDMSSSQDHYGFMICNQSSDPLYIYILYFDASEYTISMIICPALSQN